MASVLTKTVISKNVPILKCIKGRNVGFWAKKTPVMSVSRSMKKGFSTQRMQTFFSRPQVTTKQMPGEIPKKRSICRAETLPRSVSCSTLATRRLNQPSPLQSKSLVNLNVTRACSSKGQQGGQQQQGGAGEICAMGPCNCPWPGGCPPPGFCQQAACNPCAMGCGCCAPCPQCPQCPQCGFPPNTQCPCCGVAQCQACGPCVPCGACGACGMPPMGGMSSMGGMPQMGSYGSWGPCGGPMCPQGVPCPFPCPCNPSGQTGSGEDSKKKN